eukprot:Phypoly_transcript_01312.p1 GENE.Phypoly_transcript_01312~~Phypoly_transcript_01312.p1  ORF type:complete len:736 (-),score=113.38 Phypoly_transcript_01312:23-2230(-)
MSGEAVLPSFMDVVRETKVEDLPVLVQKYVPPMCPSEVSTHTNIKAFLQAVQQIHNPTLSNLRVTFANAPYTLSDQLSKDVEFLHKLVCVVGHVTRVVPYKRPYGEHIQVIICDLLIPILELKDPQCTISVLKVKLEAFETISKLLELFEPQTHKYTRNIVPFLEEHFQAVLDGKIKQSGEALDLLGVMLQTYGKPFSPPTLVTLLKVTIGIFFNNDEDATSRADLLDVIGHITKKLLNITTPTSAPTTHLPKNLTTSQELDQILHSDTFPSREICQLADFIATQVMPNPENLDVWFEQSVMVLALFCGISARTGDMSFHKKIFELTSQVYLDQLKKIKHATEPERQYNIFLVQAIGRATDYSDSRILQPLLPEYLSELRQLNISTKEHKNGPKRQKLLPYFQKLRAVIIRSIASVMKAFDDFTPLADQFLRETAKELADPAIFGDFIEALRDHAPEYLGRTLKPLFRQLEKESVSMKVKQAIIDTLNRIIKHTKTAFLPFLHECATTIRPMTPSLVTDSCIPFVSLYTTILVTFGETSEIDQYIPFLLPTFIDILNQDSTQVMPTADEYSEDEKDVMDLSPFSICEALSNLRSIFSHPTLTKKILQASPTFLPELLVYLMDKIPTQITYQDETFVRVAQLEFVQQLLDSLSEELIQNDLAPLVSLILQNIELNTNEIDIQVAGFDAIAKFVAHKVPDPIARAHIQTVCTGSMFLAKEHADLHESIQRVLSGLNN